MPRMAPRTPSADARTGEIVHTNDAAPSSWGLGDGAAIPWEYAPAPESRDVVTLRERYGLFIGGREVAASDGGTFATINPATEEPLAPFARGTPSAMDRGGNAPRKTFPPPWGTLSRRE